jgi:regulator of extracellular matrix RemA (YlzA/DUF370 family)
MINIGLGNLVSADEVLAIIVSGSSPSKRLKDEAKTRGQLIDATQGRKTRAMVVTKTGHVILSAVAPETIGQRLEESATEKRLESGAEKHTNSGAERQTEPAAIEEPARRHPIEK